MRELGPWGRRLDAVFGAPIGVTAPDISRLVIWIPAVLCAGAAAYFMTPFEPPRIVAPLGLFAAFVLICGAVFARGRATALFTVLLSAALIAGFSLAQNRTLSSAPPPIAVSDRAVEVTGWIEAVERGGSRPRLLIRVRSLDGADDPPRRVRPGSMALRSPASPSLILTPLRLRRGRRFSARSRAFAGSWPNASALGPGSAPAASPPPS